MADHAGQARPRLNVAIVTYNSADHLGALLDSLPDAAPGLDLDVVVADNDSRDETVSLAATYPGVRVVPTGGNLGYSGGINVARSHFDGGHVAILNPDLTLAPGALTRLVEALEPGVGITVPRLVDASGTLFHHLRKEPSVLGALGDSLIGARWSGRPRWLSDDFRRDADYTEPIDVAWAGAAAWVVSEACDTAVGDWNDERYFLYSEETDFARRARDLGFRVSFVPEATAMHHGGGSGTSPALLALMAVNRVRYFEQQHARTRTTLFTGAVALGHLLRSPVSPAHRAALRTLVSRRRWSALPGPTRSERSNPS